MSKIYIVDYGVSSSVAGINAKINELFENNSWKCTGFNTTYWKDAEGQCSAKAEEERLRNLIKQAHPDAKNITLLVICVDKEDVIGTNEDRIIFGFSNFQYPNTNNLA